MGHMPEQAPQEDLNTPERQRVARRTTWVSVLVNVVLTLAQVVTGLITQSQALVADGMHSLSDLASDFVVLLASRHSQNPPDAEHPHGHQRFENAASLVLGLMLLAVGAALLWQAMAALAQPRASVAVHPVALAVALATLVAKEGLFRYMLAAALRVRSSMLVANAWHARSDAASSLVVALGLLGSLAGYPLLDPLAAVVVGWMVARMGWRFAWGALHDLMDRGVSADQVQAIESLLSGTPGLRGFHDLRTRKMGDQILVDVHLELPGEMSVRQAHDIALLARSRIMAELPVLNVSTHIDPLPRPHEPGR